MKDPFLGAALAFMCLACATDSPVTPIDSCRVLTPSQLNADPGQFDGEYVCVDGVVVIGPERRHFVDPGAAYSKDACITLLNTEFLFAHGMFFNRMHLELRGRFRRDAIPGDVLDLAACNETGLEVDESDLKAKFEAVVEKGVEPGTP